MRHVFGIRISSKPVIARLNEVGVVKAKRLSKNTFDFKNEKETSGMSAIASELEQRRLENHRATARKNFIRYISE